MPSNETLMVHKWTYDEIYIHKATNITDEQWKLITESVNLAAAASNDEKWTEDEVKKKISANNLDVYFFLQKQYNSSQTDRSFIETYHPLGVLQFNPKTRFITNFAIFKKAQGQGVGFLSLKKFMAMIKAKYPEQDIYINVATSNTKAKALYLKVGFVEESTENGACHMTYKPNHETTESHESLEKYEPGQMQISDIKSIDDLKAFYKTVKYGFRDADRDAHTKWRLSSYRYLMHHPVGICYDTAAMSDHFLTQWGIQHRVLFLYTDEQNWESNPTHLTVIYLDKADNKWKWLEGSWNSFKNNHWSESAGKVLALNIAKAHANSCHKPTNIGIVDKIPVDGTCMVEFYGMMRAQAEKMSLGKVSPDAKYAKEDLNSFYRQYNQYEPQYIKGPITYNHSALQQIRNVIKYREDEITDNTEDIEVASFDTHRLAYTAQMIYEFYVKLILRHNANVMATIRQYQDIYPELNCSAVDKHVECYKENLLTPEYIGAYAPYIVKDHLIMKEYDNEIDGLARVYKLDDDYYEKYMEALEKKRRTELLSYPEHWQTPDDMPDYALRLYAIELFYSTVDLVRTKHPLKMDNNCAITDPKKRALVMDFISELNEEHYQHVSVEAVQAKEMLPDSVKNKLGKYLYHGTHRDLDIKQLAVHFCRNRANRDIKAPVVYMTRSLGLASLHCAEFMKGHASKKSDYREHFVEFDKAKDSDQIFKHVEIVHNDPDLPEASGENDGFIYCTETEKCVDKLYFSTPKNKNDYLFVSYSPLPVDKKMRIHITWHRKYDENFAKEVSSNKYAGVESLTYSLENDQVQESGNYYLIRGFPVVAFFRQLGKHYKTHKLENLIQIVRSIGITQWMANSRTVKIHRFFIPEILFLMEKFRMPVTLINSIRDGTWVGEKIEHKTDCKIERVKNNMTCTLFPHQEEFIKNYAEYKESHHLRGYLLSFDQGLGKTMTSVALMEALNKDRVVVICPKNTMVETWKSHFERFFKEKQSIFVIGVDKKFEGQRFCIFNYDAIDKLNAIPGLKTDKMGIIVDECHNFLRLQAARTQKLIQLTKESDDMDVLLMSGTPIKAASQELVPLISMLDPLFDEEAIRIFKDSFGVNTKIATEVLHARLKRMMERVTKEVLDLPPKYRSTIKVKLPDGNKYTIKVVKQGMREFINSRLAFHRDNMVLYRQEFDECMEFLKTTPIYQTEEFKKYKVIVERLIHDHGQYEHGDAEISWMNEYEKTVVEKQFNSELLHKFRHCKAAIKYLHLKVRGEVLGQFLARLRIEMTTKMLKTVDIKALINEAKKKTIIFTSYIDTIEACEQYVKSLGFKPIVIYGKNSGEIAPLAAKFQKDPQFNPLIASLQTLSTGATLTAANRVIFLNKPWRSVDYAQASDRVHRIGQDTAVDIISLVLDTGEEGNLSTRMEDIMDESARAFDAIVEERKEQSDKKKASHEWLLPADVKAEIRESVAIITDTIEPSMEGMTLLHDTKEQRKLNKMARPHYRERGANSWEHVQQDMANGILLVKKLKHRDLTLQEYATILYHDCGCKSMYPEKEGHGLRGVEIAKPELKKCGFFSDKEIDEICTAILEHDETTNPKNMHSSELSDLLASADTNPPDIPWILNKSYVWGLRHGYTNHDKNIENVVAFMKKENGTKGNMIYPKLYSEYYKKEIKQMQEFFDNLTVEECAKIVDEYRKENELRHNELTLPEPDTDQKIVEPSTEGYSMEAAANIKAKRKKIQDYILNAMKTLDPHTDTNYKYWKNKFDSMNDKDFDKFMHYLREGKTNIHMFVPPFKVTLQTRELLEAAHKYGVKIMHRIWMHDPQTGIKYLTPEEYMVLQLPVRRQQQFLDEKLSVPDNDKTIDGLTGQVTGDSKSCSITNPEIQILHARNLDATLYELTNVRGGNIRNYAEFKRSLEETGEIKLNQLDPTNRTRVAVMGQVLLTAMHLDVNLVDI